MAALWLVVLVGVTGYELSVRSHVRRLAVANSLEATQASAAAAAGLETIRAALEYRLAHPLIERTRRLDDATVDPLGDLTFLRADTIALGDERTVARTYDAGSRLQINHATEDDLRRLFVALDIDASDADRLAQRILDWRDADDLRRGRGAERADYLRNGARALPSNADFQNIDELRNVEGMTDVLFARIAPHLVTMGRGQINVNAAPRAVLRSLPRINDEIIDAILHARQSGRPLRSLDELSQHVSSGARELLVGVTPELSSRMTFDTREIVVESDGWVDGSAVHVHAATLYERTGDALITVLRRAGR